MSKYAIPVVDKPDRSILDTQWKIKEKKGNKVVLETIEQEEASPYTKQNVELYISRLSLSYDKSRPACLDKVSKSFNSSIGVPRTSSVSKSFNPIGGSTSSTVSSGWRPWSKVSTCGISAPCETSSFDRTYSRSYARAYSRPYNTDPVISIASYSTSTTSRDKYRYNSTGTSQSVLHRPNRDYKSRLGGDYGVKSYNRKVLDTGHSSLYDIYKY
eukprot:TRINITY_DN11999_c0_g1_i1.p1 TRINITY_DN11999_c0_g1~~TRINITY_DN11999_c0_g1_i1.p1  ORF type:complete len:228 (-),score=30.22 TRINITY_DN11999_c0_g1_i1:44-685(-)